MQDWGILKEAVVSCCFRETRGDAQLFGGATLIPAVRLLLFSFLYYYFFYSVCCYFVTLVGHK